MNVPHAGATAFLAALAFGSSTLAAPPSIYIDTGENAASWTDIVRQVAFTDSSCNDTGGVAARMRARGDLMQSVERLAATAPNTLLTRRSLLLTMRTSNLCYEANLPPEELDRLIAATHLLPASGIGVRFEPRFNLVGTVWTGDGGQGSSGQAGKARLTYSFAPDNTIWGTDSSFVSLPNGLNSALLTNFGVLDTGREWIRQSLAAWKRCAGIRYDEVADSGIPMDLVTTRRSTVGDVRIGGHAFIQSNGGTNLASVLAYNNFPGSASQSGSDMVINLLKFDPDRFMKPDNNFRYFRNVIAHEHGHGLGFIHQVPCDGTKMMEPSVNTSFDVLQVDDRRGAGSAYGDRFSGNNSAANAVHLGGFPSMQQTAVLLRDLSTNGASGPNNSSEDWFRFQVVSAGSFTVTMTPTGGSYATGPQSMDCDGTLAALAAFAAGNLNVEIRDNAGTTVLGSSSNGAGLSDSITLVLQPGTYTVRVFDIGPNISQTVQLYDLFVGQTGGIYSPYANAGINKRINVGEVCQFMGDVNSIPGPLPINSYQWDLDGNGVTETFVPRPVTIYTVPGIRTVQMGVVDTLGHYSLDAITVTVIGAAPSFTSCSPNSGNPGTTVPVTINGSSLGSPTMSVSGTGVSIIGTPSVDLASIASPITGLSFAIDPTAPPGPRSVTITTPSGTVTANNAFTVNALPSTISSVTPASGLRGQSIPITINGANFHTPLTVGISGTGITVSGTPVINAARTQITGISFNIAANATLSARTVTITNPGGSPTGTFTVVSTNDLCANPLILSLGGTINGNNAGSTTDGSVSSACTSSSNKDLYYAFTPPCTGSYRFQTGPASLDTVLSVHASCPASASSSIACNDDLTPGSELNSRIDAMLTGGTLYTIRVAAFGTTAGGAFTLSVTGNTPANDHCVNAAPLPIGRTDFNGCTADSESLGYISCTSITSDVWYTFTAERSARTTIDTCGSDFDTVLEVYPAPCNTGSIFPIACDDDTCGAASRISFAAVGGTTYLIRASAYFQIGGQTTGGTGIITRYCPSDFDLNTFRTIDDIFIFLNAWFAQDPRCDVDGLSGVNIDDIFIFLNIWFGGC
jgi:hypothetical protein